ncbi:MAG: TIGR04283 family arsenosugar biosynthesis glycosyltransferase [Bacteroidetes bacterium]|nr:TIGR04283 family arsenosugar biosynthesis glycosyltransferase [Bacteroidota bacterium]MDE2673428.1 TIGR04283 family arsenosugar biosynthesis glycosyltransferase [Bacteroidota bacterium]
MICSVVIPTYNEGAYIEAALESVREQSPPWEIIVADGASTDETCQIASSCAKVIRVARGRAHQMNAGAHMAEGELLVFLHADSRLPSGALDHLRQLFYQGSLEAGIFALKFDPTGFWPSIYAACARLPWHRLCFGDRGIFIRRDVFETLGGFPEVPIFEDLQLVKQLHRRKSFHYVQMSVTTAYRRFEHYGHLRQQCHNLRLWLQYHMGTPPEKLAPLYPYGTLTKLSAGNDAM